MRMAEDWESLKRELLDVFGNHRAGYEPFKNDLWSKHKEKFQKELDEFVAMPAPATASDLAKRQAHKDRLVTEWERTILIADAEIGTRGQGGVVRSLFTLNDSIQALDAGSTKLGNRMYWLTWAIAIMTAVMVVDILAKWGEVVSERWGKNQPAVERQETQEKPPTSGQSGEIKN
jgi:hypothetical protein